MASSRAGILTWCHGTRQEVLEIQWNTFCSIMSMFICMILPYTLKSGFNHSFNGRFWGEYFLFLFCLRCLSLNVRIFAKSNANVEYWQTITATLMLSHCLAIKGMGFYLLWYTIKSTVNHLCNDKNILTSHTWR